MRHHTAGCGGSRWASLTPCPSPLLALSFATKCHWAIFITPLFLARGGGVDRAEFVISSEGYRAPCWAGRGPAVRFGRAYYTRPPRLLTLRLPASSDAFFLASMVQSSCVRPVKQQPTKVQTRVASFVFDVFFFTHFAHNRRVPCRQSSPPRDRKGKEDAIKRYPLTDLRHTALSGLGPRAAGADEAHAVMSTPRAARAAYTVGYVAGH